jgi:hypothetical protein
LVASDVTIDGKHFTGALVQLSFSADTKTVIPFFDANSYGFMNLAGKARVTVIAGGQVINASFAPNQLYVYFDIKNSAVGFGSKTAGRGYPLALTATEPPSIYAFENSTLGAVGDILRAPANAVKYTPLTQTLITDLTKPNHFEWERVVLWKFGSDYGHLLQPYSSCPGHRPRPVLPLRTLYCGRLWLRKPTLLRQLRDLLGGKRRRKKIG